LPAYDEALRYLMKDSAALKKEIGELGASIQREEGALERDEAALETKRKRLDILKVQSEINLPEIRWKVANGMADMTKTVHRHLLEQRWREDGPLDLLMERIHQMHVVPDVIGSFHPSLDLRLVTPGNCGTTERYRSDKPLPVEPGVYLLPQQTRVPPRLYPVVYHDETRLYTLLMVDPDVPDEANQTYQTYVHWLKPNIPLSALSSSAQLANLNTHTPYIPPHPQRGTSYHRYTTLLLPQRFRISVPVLSQKQRCGFDVRTFIEKYKFEDSKGGGIHMFREVWNEEVSNIYQEILGVEEPKFGRPKKEDPYAGRGKRYVL
jgi:large subunit ribosomal protein L35